MKIDYELLKTKCGLDFKGTFRQENLLFYVKGILWRLKIMNEDCVKERIERINLLNDIFECID